MGFRVALDLSASVPVARRDFFFQGLVSKLAFFTWPNYPLSVKTEERHF